jgi:hypothetical protein
MAEPEAQPGQQQRHRGRQRHGWKQLPVAVANERATLTKSALMGNFKRNELYS